jgi:hypothetical protein
MSPALGSRAADQPERLGVFRSARSLRSVSPTRQIDARTTMNNDETGIRHRRRRCARLRAC